MFIRYPVLYVISLPYVHLSFFFSLSRATSLIRRFLVLDKICGSKNWARSVHRKLQQRRTALKSAALSQILIYKNIHMSNLLYPLTSSPITSRLRVQESVLSLDTLFVSGTSSSLFFFVLFSPRFRFVSLNHSMYTCMLYVCVLLIYVVFFLSLLLITRTSTYSPVKSR